MTTSSTTYAEIPPQIQTACFSTVTWKKSSHREMCHLSFFVRFVLVGRTDTAKKEKTFKS